MVVYKRKTEYAIWYGMVGAEMWRRDRADREISVERRGREYSSKKGIYIGWKGGGREHTG